MAIETVGKNEEEYETLEDFISSDTIRFNYTEFEEAYNSAPVDQILVLEYQGSMTGNFVKMLKKRSLVKGEDYTMRTTQEQKNNYKIVMKKLTKKSCLVIN